MKRLILLSFFVFTGFIGISQDGHRLEALKIAYITKNLDLSPAEAQRFWPIYNQYSSELLQARLNAIGNKSTEIELDEAVLNIRKKYSVQFSQVLSPQKVDIFFKSEKDFGRYVQKELERRQMKNQRKFQDSP